MCDHYRDHLSALPRPPGIPYTSGSNSYEDQCVGRSARPQLDEFLGLVGVEMPAAPPPPAAAPAAVAVAVKLPPRLQALADKLDLERDEVDEILESVDHDVEQAIEFIREEYREQLGDAAEHSEESDEEDESETHMAGRDSIDDLSGGWGGDSEYDPRATTTQVQVLDTIDETDNEVTLHGDLNFMDDYFSAEAEPRRVQQRIGETAQHG